MRPTAGAGRGGFTVVEVTVATAIGGLVLAGAAVLLSTATKSNARLISRAETRQESAAAQAAIKNELTMSNVDRAATLDDSDGNRVLTFDHVIGLVLGIPVWGIELSPLGTPVDVSKLLAGAPAPNNLPIGVALPLGNKVVGGKFRYAVLPHEGVHCLFRLAIDALGCAVRADCVIANVGRAWDVTNALEVTQEGDAMVIKLQCRTGPKDDAKGYSVETLEIRAIPKN